MTVITTTTPPDLTAYRAVHRALRNGAWALAATAPAIAEADPLRRRAFTRYWKGYAGEVLAHHTGEDEFFFPALVERVPVAAELVVRTDAEHLELDELMDAIAEQVAEVRAGRPALELPALTTALAEHMQEHLDMEDAEVLPLFERHFTGAEYAAMDEKVVKALGVGPQAAFTVPFVLSAMTPDERSAAIASAPMPLRVLNAACRGPHARLVRRAFGSQPGGVA